MGYGGGLFGSTTRHGHTYNRFLGSSGYNYTRHERSKNGDPHGFNHSIKEETKQYKQNGADTLIQVLWGIAITALIISIIYIIIDDSLDSLFHGLFGFLGF